MIATHCLLQRCIYHIATNNHNKENRHKYNDFRAQNVFPAQKVINKIQGDDRKQVEGEGRRFKALKVLKALKALKGFKDLSGLSGPSWLGWLGWPFLPLVSFLIPVPKTHLNFEFTKQATPASCHDCRRQAVGIYQLSSQQSAVSSQQSAVGSQQSAVSSQRSAVGGRRSVNCPFCLHKPLRPSATSPNLGEEWSDGTYRSFLPAPPDLPFRRGGVLGGAIKCSRNIY